MPTPFDFWTIEDAKVATALPAEEQSQLDSYRAFVEGDHWQDWAGWTGPVPVQDDPDYQSLVDEIERGFVSRGVIREVVDRHVSGVLGRDVKWDIVPRRELDEGEEPTEEEQTRIDEAKQWLSQWIEERKMHETYDEVGRILMYAGKAYQRIFIVPGALDDNGNLPPGDVPTQMGHIYVDFLEPGSATIYTDPNTQSKCSIYLYREMVSDRPSQQQNAEGEDRAELTYLDGDMTIIRILGSAPEQDQPDFAYTLGGRIFMAELERPALLNDQIVSLQKLLNKTISMKSRNMDMAGFRERVTINARMGGSYQTDSSGKEVFVPHSLPTGPSSMLNLTGYKLYDAEGNESLARPEFQWIDPVPVTTFLETEDSTYTAMLAESNQLHYAMSDDANASGYSRDVAMAAYLMDLLQTKQQVDGGWSWMLETVLALGATAGGQQGRYDDLRATAESTVDPGPISAEMLRLIMDQWREGFLSLSTALSRSGIEDVEGEIARIRAEEAERAEMFPETSAIERQFGRDLANQANGEGETEGEGENGFV